MEIKQYLFLARKWAWLVILGTVVGAAFSYYFSSRQPTIYQTQTRIMVSRATEDQGNSYYNSDMQLARTYAQLINTGPVMQALGEKLGYPVGSSQIKVEQVADSLLLRITVTDGDPLHAAQIANGIVEVFIDYNENLQVGRYQASEETLQAQINQVEAQVNQIQSEMAQMTEQTQEIQLQEQQLRLQERLAGLKEELDSTEAEIIAVESQIALFFPTPVPGPTPVNAWQNTPTPLPTPTLSPVQAVQLKEAQNQLDQLQTFRNLYKQTYASLLVLGDNTTDSTINTQQRQEQLQTTLALYQQIYSNLLNNYEAVRLARLRSTPNVVQIEQAAVPSVPIQPQPMRNGLLGAIFGAIMMGALAFVIEYLDDTLKTPEDISHFLHLPVIGLIGEMDQPKGKDKKPLPGVFVAENPLSPVTEAFRSLRTNLEFAGVDNPLRTILVTSTSPSEGKSTVSANLAAVIAQGERSVVLVDTDLRRPAVHRYLGIPNRHGLTDIFRDQSQLANVIISWGSPPIAVITSGSLPPNPAELLASERLQSILNLLKEQFDMVIIDSPPVIVTDPISLSAKVDGVLLVVEPGKTKIGAAQVVMEQMQRAGARVIGAVLNPISRRRANYYSKYRYYSTYYYYSRGYNRYVGSNGNGKSNGRANGKVKTQEKQPVSPQGDGPA